MCSCQMIDGSSHATLFSCDSTTKGCSSDNTLAVRHGSVSTASLRCMSRTAPNQDSVHTIVFPAFIGIVAAPGTPPEVSSVSG